MYPSSSLSNAWKISLAFCISRGDSILTSWNWIIWNMSAHSLSVCNYYRQFTQYWRKYKLQSYLFPCAFFGKLFWLNFSRQTFYSVSVSVLAFDFRILGKKLKEFLERHTTHILQYVCDGNLLHAFCRSRKQEEGIPKEWGYIHGYAASLIPAALISLVLSTILEKIEGLRTDYG